MCTATDTPSALACALTGEIQDVIRDEMTWFPTAIAYQDDVARAVLDLMPDPNAYETSADYLDAVETELDLLGCFTRESIEGLFTGIVYTHDAIDFWREYEDECDQAMSEYGIIDDLGHRGVTSVSEIITLAADYGGMWMLSNKASDICYRLDDLLEEYKANLPE